MQYSRFADIDLLYTEGYKLLELIETQYNESLHQQALDGALIINLKRYFWDMRSWLDYLAGEVGMDNFPMTDHVNWFHAKVSNLWLDQRIVDVLEKYQPYNNVVVRNFNKLRNKNVHFALTPQKRTETRGVTVSDAYGSTVTWNADSAVFGEGVSILGAPIDPVTQLPIPTEGVKVEVIKWIDFTFDNKDIPGLDNDIHVLWFIKEVFEIITNCTREIEDCLQQVT